MLYIHFGDVSDQIDYIDMYFNGNFEREWFDDPLVREMVKDVDKSTVICGSAIDSPVLGPISPRELSGGVKMLICMLKDPTNPTYWATSCGDNCAKWIIKIGKLRDVTISLSHIMKFHTREVADIGAICLNSGNKIDTMSDYLDEYFAAKERGEMY